MVLPDARDWLTQMDEEEIIGASVALVVLGVVEVDTDMELEVELSTFVAGACKII